ncbi:N-acetylmuramoyl-L-alanine amidase [Moritella viscosa]|uniref:N-acetylmuramoyl-L-alanine amidase n=1 Tax=Moritella viscosa TaxID=80854 RepID=A0A090K3Z2_9GAMM|nr:N-acetylmuramoyl-L-alanine amidase [Moritella viscosa]CED58428.1 N-acetylmuramoyl-L-alanine amidase [Moritella viscosa]SGY81793.1 Putative N-acetylmuramoyl-L-alanine amidase [Moritella viscosa]SGY81953.1 Putative N-acetylmuramoyl-L-alanine amidase [Moritella viscosa]SGY81966.1 Putative N-acetylmuramoyl-L-alanine amidase [Moritella viscosa]SGY82058.1 Putative N-acetylmuramoyl-L-alanine amidase [Moritella viscosa]
MFKRILLLSIIYLCFMPLSYAANAVYAIRIVEHADKTRIVFDLAKKPLFNLYDRHKKTQIVVDFAGTQNKVNVSKLAKLSSNIIRVEQTKSAKSSDLRIIFHLAQPIQYRFFELAGNKTARNRLVIDLPVKPTKSAKAVIKKKNPVAVKKITKKPVVRHPKRDVVIAIDAGHGGKDPGSIGFKKFVEKDITLAIAKKTVAILNQKKGIKAVLIRKDDRYISLNERSAIARKYKAELLVSVHADGFTSSNPSGASTLILSQGRANYEFKKKLRDDNVNGLLGGVGDAIKNSNGADDLQYTFLDLGRQYSQGAGYNIASLIHHELAKVTNMHKSKPYEQSLAVLKSLDIPSLLVETGFVTNYREGKKLTTSSHQYKIANAIAQGSYLYFRNAPPKDTYLAYMRNGIHVVKKGDSLSVIASSYGTTEWRIKQLNNLTKSTIFIGQKLKIPTS